MLVLLNHFPDSRDASRYCIWLLVLCLSVGSVLPAQCFGADLFFENLEELEEAESESDLELEGFSTTHPLSDVSEFLSTLHCENLTNESDTIDFVIHSTHILRGPPAA